MGFNCLKATDALRGGSLLFKTEFPKFSVLALSGVSVLDNLTIALLKEMPPI